MFIPGFHAVCQSIPAGPEKIQEVWVVEGKASGRLREVTALARRFGIPVRYKTRSDLNELLPGVSHQGFVVIAKDFEYVNLEQALDEVGGGERQPFFVAADHITDEGNLASIIRTAAFFGASGLIIPKDRSAKASPKVLKRAVGCHLYLSVSRVVNLGRALDFLSERGYWIIGATGEAAESIYRFDWNRPLVLVVGNEEKGLSQAVRKKCDALVRIPSVVGVESLNVGVATGVILSEIIRQTVKEE